LTRHRKIILSVLVGIVLLVIIGPIYWLAVTSLKPPRDLYAAVSIIPRRIVFSHFVELFTKTDFLEYVKNSLIVCTFSTVLAVTVSALAAYSIIRIRLPHRAQMAKSIIFVYLIPRSLLFIPLFVIAQKLGLVDNIWILVVTYPTFLIPFCTWVLMGTFKAIPKDVEDAASIDGCSPLQAFRKVVLPLAKPGIIAAAIYAFTLTLNEYLYALTLLHTQRTIPTGIASFMLGDAYSWGKIGASSVVVIIPLAILFGYASKYLTSGLAGATKY